MQLEVLADQDITQQCHDLAHLSSGLGKEDDVIQEPGAEQNALPQRPVQFVQINGRHTKAKPSAQ